ncbi:MAG: serine/threonine-protein kinase [Rubrivivax sp.]
MTSRRTRRSSRCSSTRRASSRGFSHPNVASVFELGIDDGRYWIAMEYLHGEALREIVEHGAATKKPIALEVACKIVIDAAEGLHAAHELTSDTGEKLNLVHRDVSPHNVFVGYDGTTKVVDFGIAKFRTRESSTYTGQLKGKLAYMSPEQLDGTTLDRRADVFALGIVLWELTTRERLFRMDSDVETFAKVYDCVVPKPSSKIPSYPKKLEEIVMKALSRKPDGRYATARDFSRALQRFLVERGSFVGSEEVAAHVKNVMSDRVAQRESHLRGAREKTDVGAAPAKPPIDESPPASRPPRPSPEKAHTAPTARRALEDLEGSLFLHTAEPPEVGTVVSIEVRTDDKVLLARRARVVRTRSVDDVGADLAGMRVEYVEDAPRISIGTGFKETAVSPEGVTTRNMTAMRTTPLMMPVAAPVSDQAAPPPSPSSSSPLERKRLPATLPPTNRAYASPVPPRPKSKAPLILAFAAGIAIIGVFAIALRIVWKLGDRAAAAAPITSAALVASASPPPSAQPLMLPTESAAPPPPPPSETVAVAQVAPPATTAKPKPRRPKPPATSKPADTEAAPPPPPAPDPPSDP